MSDMKPLLIIAAIGLGVALLVLVGMDESGSRFSITDYFDSLVDECQDAHPEWSRTDCERIVRQEAWVGMTSEMLIASLGDPRAIDQPRVNDPAYEEWTYRSTQYGEERMFLKDGIVAGWEQEPCDSCGAEPPRP